MGSKDQHKSGKKSDKRKQKHRKQQESPTPVLAQEANDPVEAMIAAEESLEHAVALEAAPAEPVERVASFRERMAALMPPVDPAPAAAETARSEPDPLAGSASPIPSSATAPVASIQAIANAYRDYTRKSLADAQSLAEKLSAARSFDKAVEAQTEFARKACENFAADSRKIRELHRELFWQAFRLPNWPPGSTRR
ncbi:MAG: phasin family protein [Bradyrhizobium sp.]|uniref:phasin family protein n=1 Tax=Bradyrhizobium sp. TaxID=376 RepID=UPI003D1127CE